MTKRKQNLKSAIRQDAILEHISGITGTSFYVSGATTLYLLSGLPVEGYFLHFYGDPEALLNFFKHDSIGKKFQQLGYDANSDTWACSVEGKNVLISHYASARELLHGARKFAETIGVPVLSLYVSLNEKKFGKILDVSDGYSDYSNKIIRLSDRHHEVFWGHPSFLLSLCYYASMFGLTPEEKFPA